MAQKPKQPRKSWFMNQAERKGQNFLDGWANGVDRDFNTPDKKIRAVDSILRDIKEGYIGMDDMVSNRLLHKDLLQSIITICHNKREFYRRMSNAFAMLNNVSQCVHAQRDYNEKVSMMSNESKAIFDSQIDPNYKWLTCSYPIEGAIDPNTGSWVGGIPLAHEFADACEHGEYIKHKFIADALVKTYNEVEVVFYDIYIGVCNGTLRPDYKSTIECVRAALNNLSRNNSPFQNRLMIPLDANVLAGYDFTV